ncbi:MAG: OmpH family outer membrane protein, partial [Candidatus Dadabacteria bacterium]
IAVIDIQHVLDEADIARKASKELKSEIKRRESELLKEKRIINQLRNELTKKEAVLSEKALEEKSEKLRRKEKEFARKMQDHKEALSKLRAKKMGAILKKIYDITSDLAKEKGYNLVLEKDPRVVVYSADALDISSEVIKRLNKK